MERQKFLRATADVVLTRLLVVRNLLREKPLVLFERLINFTELSFFSSRRFERSKAGFKPLNVRHRIFGE